MRIFAYVLTLSILTKVFLYVSLLWWEYPSLRLSNQLFLFSSYQSKPGKKLLCICCWCFERILDANVWWIRQYRNISSCRQLFSSVYTFKNRPIHLSVKHGVFLDFISSVDFCSHSISLISYPLTYVISKMLFVYMLFCKSPCRQDSMNIIFRGKQYNLRCN